MVITVKGLGSCWSSGGDAIAGSHLWGLGKELEVLIQTSVKCIGLDTVTFCGGSE